MEQKTWNCVYHPHQKMRVVSDEEKEELLATGEWFDHPTKAQEAKGKDNEQVRKKPRLHTARRKRGADLQQPSEDGAESA